ncbi:MAG TPA: 3-oxoacyl-[acyl-carrier-protein] synthase III C-terminal domain-containing protein [Pseudonocardiaceae bacterium]|jgi:3-oxoacyl-[acyl-carrier-protein] synthase-3|nr:3-oxoacyl-[acyl-carrier-protein] synthase III C-terminal domain-containing protein [Pseudonocardiaceae bacterium]
MTAIDDVAAYLPDERVPIADLADRLDLTQRQVQVFHRFHGLRDVCRQKPGATLAELLTGAVNGLAELRGQEHRVRYVMYARAISVTVPFPMNPLHEMCRAVGLSHAVAFTLTHHACATGLLAVDIAGRMLATDGEPGALALIVAGEKTFTRDAELVPETSVFGEGASACIVSSDGPRDRLVSYVTSTRGDFDGLLSADADLLARYQKAYPDALAGVMFGAAERAGMRLDEMSLILPHNVNVVSWRRLCRQIGYPLDRVVLDNVPLTGHNFAADLFINYRTAKDQGRFKPGDRYLVAAAGLGATFSAMVFEH